MYWNGASTEAGVSASALVMNTKQTIATMPSRNSSARSNGPGDDEGEGQRRRADQARAAELPDDEMQPMHAAQRARDRLAERRT